MAFSGCLSTYNLRRRKEYFNLLHRMAQISADNNDNRRAVRYYNEILQKYIEDKKTSEIIYVSEIMCKIFWDNGEFRLAEDYLRDALAVTSCFLPFSILLLSFSLPLSTWLRFSVCRTIFLIRFFSFFLSRQRTREWTRECSNCNSNSQRSTPKAVGSNGKPTRYLVRTNVCVKF